MRIWATDTQIGYLLEREKAERLAAEHSADTIARDAHIVIAERYADEAWSLAEKEDGPYVPSGLWRFASA